MDDIDIESKSESESESESKEKHTKAVKAACQILIDAGLDTIIIMCEGAIADGDGNTRSSIILHGTSNRLATLLFNGGSEILSAVREKDPETVRDIASRAMLKIIADVLTDNDTISDSDADDPFLCGIDRIRSPYRDN